MATSSNPTPGDDFPLLCETCLGPNPYVRMTKLPPNSRLCQVSKLPMQSFRWKAGPGGRHKETVVSYVVARDKNICQCCLNDLRFGLPVGVRDAILNGQGGEVGAGVGAVIVNGSKTGRGEIMPTSIPGLQQYYGSKKRAIEDLDAADAKSGSSLSIWANEEGPSIGSAHDEVNQFRHQIAISQLDRLSSQVSRSNVYHQPSSSSTITHTSTTSTAFRNLPKLCSFWLNGSCNRVIRKTCPYRPCCGTFVFPEIARTNKELHQTLIERLQSEGAAVVMKSLDKETKTAIHQALKGNREESILKRVNGQDELSTKYIERVKEHTQSVKLPPPTDSTIITLWLGNLPIDMTEEELRGLIYPYGMIRSVRIVSKSNSTPCAFVEYVDRANAEQAAAHLYRMLIIRGQEISVNWAKPKPNAQTHGQFGNVPLGVSYHPSAMGSPYFMPAPPGMENIHYSAYALPGMALPIVPPPPQLHAPSSSAALDKAVDSVLKDNKRRKTDDDKHGNSSNEVDSGSIGGGLLGLVDYADDE